MWLFGAQRLALWIQRGAVWSEEGLQVGKPALAVRWRWRDDRKHTLRQRPSQRRDEYGGARPRQTSDADTMTGRRKSLAERCCRRQFAEAVEQEIERH